jgi:DNA-binding NarL/FixJ family response regulator
MRERAHLVGGELVITSTPGEGTEVSMWLPMRPVEARSTENGMQQVMPSETPLRVLIVDDHPLFRAGLRNLLEEVMGIRVVGEAGSVEETHAAVQMLGPDLILLDFDLPDGSGLDVAEQIERDSPETIIVMMSAFDEAENVARALALGVNGYVTKGTSRAVLIDTIRAVRRGASVVNGVRRPTDSTDSPNLTARELEVLERIAAGQTNAEIGQELYIAPKTVERIVASAVQKLGCKNRTHAVARAIAAHVITCRDI